MNFFLGWQGVLFLNFQSPEHERSQQSVDLSDYFLLLFLVVFLLIRQRKKLRKLVSRLEKFGHQKVKKRP